MWTLLLLTLPAQPNAVRLRVWRALKAMGCAALRDGAYVLPAAHGQRFESLAAEVREHGGSASVLDLAPRDDAQRDEVLALFDRGEAYAAWRASAQALRESLEARASPDSPESRTPRRPREPRASSEVLTEAEARRRLRAVGEALDAVRDVDYYPGAAAAQAAADLQALRAAVDATFSVGEPMAMAAPGAGIARLDRRRFQGKCWATRARPWVDRLACAWLIRRFIDPKARFAWLDDKLRVPRGAIGFDFDGARFTHVGARVTFEVMAASFALDADPRVQRIARTVRYLDVGGIPVPEAAGLEAVLAGTREVHADDDRLVAAAGKVFDAWYAAPGVAA